MYIVLLLSSTFTKDSSTTFSSSSVKGCSGSLIVRTRSLSEEQLRKEQGDIRTISDRHSLRVILAYGEHFRETLRDKFLE